MERPYRAAYFTVEEQTGIIQKYEEFKDTIQAKSNNVATAKAREQCWQNIADSVNV